MKYGSKGWRKKEKEIRKTNMDPELNIK